MPLTLERKEELARMSPVSNAEMQQRMRSFMLRSGMSAREFGEQIGYSKSTIGEFLRGDYWTRHPEDADAAALKAAARDYMEEHELLNGYTFRGTHHNTESFMAVRASALSALELGSAYLVDGPPGTEKTYSLRRIEKEINESNLGRAVYVYARVNHSPQSFLIECCTAAGIPNRGYIDELIRKLRFHLASGRTLLIVDEAQHLDRRGLEVLRQLLDLPPFFGVMLAGSHDLTQRLSHWEMEQWRSRLRKTHYLNGPSDKEAAAILRAELGELTDKQCNEFIARCISTGQRMEKQKDGKLAAKKFSYISARDLFNAIEGIQHARKAGAA